MHQLTPPSPQRIPQLGAWLIAIATWGCGDGAAQDQRPETILPSGAETTDAGAAVADAPRASLPDAAAVGSPDVAATGDTSQTALRDTGQADGGHGAAMDTGAGGATGDVAGFDAGSGADASANGAGGGASGGSPPAGHIHGWPRTTWVFSQGRMLDNDTNDDWVELGWIALDAEQTAQACGAFGPRVERHFYHWEHSRYPTGECPQDVSTIPSRWDHAAAVVDSCPPAADWVVRTASGSYTQATQAFVRNGCKAHVTAGFGKDAHRQTYVGNYAYDASQGTLVLRYAVPASPGSAQTLCRKEYYVDVRLDPTGRLVRARLDGARTADRSTASRGLGASHGFAWGSPRGIEAHVPLAQAMDVFGSPAGMREHRWNFRESSGAADDDRGPRELGHVYTACGDVFYRHNCKAAQVGEQRYLRACQPGQTAYLQYMVDPFPARPSRENLYWAWHASKIGWGEGCYHQGAHAQPLLQVIDAHGAFRGFVGVEMQRSQNGGYQETDYKAFWRMEPGAL